MWCSVFDKLLLQDIALRSTMVEEKGCKDNSDLTCIHWGYLNVLHLNDVSGKRIKNPSWLTFWTDLCGSTLRLYKDISLPENNSTFPPATVIGPRPESQVKYAFFSLKNGTVKDFDAGENSPRRRNKLARKHVLQVILANSSVYCLQAPTMSAFYRWKTKIQSSIDNADGPEKLYDKQLRDAKLALYQQRRCYFKPEPTYPDVVDEDTDDEENVSSVSPLQDPRLIALKQKLREKRLLLSQLEKQEKDFLGTDKDDQCIITRIEFSATAKKNYFLVMSRRDTLIPEGSTFTIFGRLPNGRWRCYMDRDDRQRFNEDNTGHQRDVECNSYPLIGSVPTSVIVELNQPSRIKDFVDSLSVSASELSPPGTPADDISANSFTYEVIPPLSPQSPRRSSEPYSHHKSTNTNNLRLTKSAPPSSGKSPSPSSRPTKLTPPGRPAQAFKTRVIRPSDSSISPTSPDTPTQSVSNAISDLNQALKSLAALSPRPKVTSAVSTCSVASTTSEKVATIPRPKVTSAVSTCSVTSTTGQEAASTPRSRVSSAVSTCSRTSTSSQEDESSDMSRGSRIALVSDDESTKNTHSRSDGVVRRRKKRDIHISRKLHAKGISLIVGSSSSSEDEDENEETARGLSTNDRLKDKMNTAQSRKIEVLHSSKEKLTEKVTKGLKSSPESTVKRTSEDRSNVDKPTTTTDLLREFSENSCYGSSYGLPIRNSVTQAQFKPLASHEIPPPLHQRRTLQMTRKDNEGFGFVLQTHTIIQPGAYSDTMTFVSNVSEDGPAYLAGMRPGDVIIEVENMTVEDDNHQMIVDSLGTAGLTIRLVVVYKDAIRRMRLSTRLLALKARLHDAEKAYDALSKKERMLLDHVKDPSVQDIKVRMAVIYIHIQIASTTFARHTPEIKNSVVQTKRTPTELLQLKQSSEMTRNCGVPTTGYELVREFSTTSETKEELENQRTTASPKYASDTALNIAKKRKVGESIFKQKTLKQCQRSSFVSYIDLDANDSVSSRRRVKSDSYDPDDESKLSNDFAKIDEVPPMANTLPVQSRVTRPESYMFALGSQNALDKSYFKDIPEPSITESTLEDGFV